MKIVIDDLRGPEIGALLEAHQAEFARYSPPESCHVLDVNRLRQPGITFWTAWDSGTLLGCGALKELTPEHAEIKSMRTAPGHLRKGVASRLLDHILAEARRRGIRKISLETGSMAFFEPARRLYTKFGFRPCGPFGDYRTDPNSVFMTLELTNTP